MRTFSYWLPLASVAALVVATAAKAAHLSMAMPGLAGAIVAPPSATLLVVATLAALVQGAGLLRRASAGRELAWLFALAPLAVSAVRAFTLGERASAIAAVGAATSEHMWALLATVALVVGFGAARVVALALDWRASAQPAQPRAHAALATLLFTTPFVALIVTSSTGVDWTSSWIRWGGCGLAIIVCVLAALVPDRGEARALGVVTFALAAGLSLLAEREYVEALGHDAVAHRDPFAPLVEWVRGLQQIAAAVEPRERYGPLAALLPVLLLVLVRQTAWRAVLPRLTIGASLLVLAVGAATSVSARLAARSTSTDAAFLDSAAEPPELVWSRRVLPRTAAWVAAKAPPLQISPERCSAWLAPR